MAPQVDYEEGTSFYGAVEIAPKVEERMTNHRSKTLKLLVGLAFIAVALTAAVFAFTSPVDNQSVDSVVDYEFVPAQNTDDNLPHFSEQTCFCQSACKKEGGYSNEGVCKVATSTDSGFDSFACQDFLGRQAALCTADQVALLGADVAVTDMCAQCDVVVGANTCWSDPCKNGGVCADRVKISSTDLLEGVEAENPQVLGYRCHCPFGYSGVNCEIEVDFCFSDNDPFADTIKFCGNGARNHECTTDEDCKYVDAVTTDYDTTPALCNDVGVRVCSEFASCSQTTAENGQRSYSCQCNAGFEGDGYQPRQAQVAYGSILSAQCANGVSTPDNQDVSIAADLIVSHGWLDRDCDATSNVYDQAGCANINGCTIDPPVCKNSGTCTDIYPETGVPNDFNCDCFTVQRGTNADGTAYMAPLWKGEKCEEDIDECTELDNMCGDLNRANCVNYNAADDTEPRAADGFDCTCKQGWVSLGFTNGVFNGCEDEDDCADKPCKNGATCQNDGLGTGRFSCTCALGWKGETCEEDIDECLPNGAGDNACAAENNQECMNTFATNDDTGSIEGNAQGWYCVCSQYWCWRDEVIPPAIPANNNICVDCDDCLDTPCSNGATCINLGESVPQDWECICPPGWEGYNCDEDIDECEAVHTTGGLGCDDSGKNCKIDPASKVDRMNNCLDNTRCINTDGSWECQCYDGYFGNAVDFCEDVDDCKRRQTVEYFCASDMQACTYDESAADAGCGGKCVYTDADGFTTATVTRCADAAGCASDAEILKVFGSGVAASDFTCDMSYNECTNDVSKTMDAYPREIEYTFANNVVSEKILYKTTSKFITPAPWVLDKVLFDENGDDVVHQCGYMVSSSPRDIWKATGQCKDHGINSFGCVCNEGWTDANCDVDISECQLDIDDCDRNAACTETKGSFLCTCKYGYEDAIPECRAAQKDAAVYAGMSHDQKRRCGIKCSDIDDCVGPDARCAHGQCRDIGAMAYRCKCDAGWTDYHCDADINECGLMTDDCDDQYATCRNTVGSWECECIEGYVGSGKEGECEPIDDCAANPCEHGKCRDIGNAYSCMCDPGWKDKHCDHDVNECVSATNHDCHAAGRCVNNPGSFYCRCVAGFQGDGYTCTDLDDCDPDPCLPDGGEDKLCRAPGVLKPTGIYYCDIPEENLRCHDLGARNFECRTCPGWDPISLEDNDECQEKTDECAPNGSTCTNTVGSYTCECMAGFYDPCICEDVPLNSLVALDECPVCQTADGETCKPGRRCIPCTDCKAGPDTPTTAYACPNDANLPESHWYWPIFPEFNGGVPTNPGRSTGRGFEKVPGSTCIHTDVECRNINECDPTVMDRDSVIQYNGKKCSSAEEANCYDECGTVTCRCRGLDTDCRNERDCYYGDGETCYQCTACKAHECEAFEPTPESDRVCKPLIPDGPFAIETTSGHTAQCLVKWGEEQKVFPERYNWGGKSPTSNGGKTDGMDVADLCKSPICGVCDWNGQSSKQNILSGGEAAWTFRHLGDDGEDYLIMSAMGGKGYMCLGFRAPGAPYPELLRWEERRIEDASGSCTIGVCQDGAACWSDDGCGTGPCLKKQCANNEACGVAGTCPDGVTRCIVGDTQRPCPTGACEDGKGKLPTMMCDDGTTACTADTDCTGTESCNAQLCTVGTDAGCIATVAECKKSSAVQGMWTNLAPEQPVNEWKGYNCGMGSEAQVVANDAVVWNIIPLGQRSKHGQIGECRSKKVCAEAVYENLFVFRSKARDGTNYECLHFHDHDLNQYTHPTRIEGLTDPMFNSAGNLCNIVTMAGQTDEDALIEDKGAVWKLIPLF